MVVTDYCKKILTCMDYLALSVQIVQAVQHNLNEQSECVKHKVFIHEMALQYPERLFYVARKGNPYILNFC